MLRLFVLTLTLATPVAAQPEEEWKGWTLNGSTELGECVGRSKARQSLGSPDTFHVIDSRLVLRPERGEAFVNVEFNVHRHSPGTGSIVLTYCYFVDSEMRVFEMTDLYGDG